MSIHIGFCSKEDIPNLKEFLHKHWRPNHIFCHHQTLFDWQHWNEEMNAYHFLLARDEKEEILGVLGFIPTFQYDASLEKKGDFFGAIWRINEQHPKSVGLGHMLFRKLLKLPHFKHFGSLGISQDTINYMKIMRYHVGEMNHYFLLNPQINSFQIAQINTPIILNQPNNPSEEVTFKAISDLHNIQEFETSYKPKKTITYLINRYVNHPVFRYKFYLSSVSDNHLALFVVRKVTVNDAVCLRIVDVFGKIEEHPSLQFHWEKTLMDEGAEYVDCYNIGIDKEHFERLGFVKKMSGMDVVIPNYFEPFEQKNIPLFYAFNAPNYVLFRGDSDQDRPNTTTI
jgi:hypothetical protein